MSGSKMDWALFMARVMCLLINALDASGSTGVADASWAFYKALLGADKDLAERLGRHSAVKSNTALMDDNFLLRSPSWITQEEWTSSTWISSEKSCKTPFANRYHLRMGGKRPPHLPIVTNF
jgi:hypothetical protein